MEKIDELLKSIKEYNEKYIITEKSSEAEKLRAKLMATNLSKEDCLNLQQEVIAFLKSDVSEADKEMIKGYTEAVSMICSAIKDNLLE